MNLTTFRKLYKLHSDNFFTFTNPKVLKNGKVSKVPTVVLMLKPSPNACAGMGSCAKLCLNMAGHPIYLKGKLACRDRRDKALNNDTQAFYNMLLVELFRFYSKNREYENLSARLNGVSDYAFEKPYIDKLQTLTSIVDVTQETQKEVKKKFNISINVGKNNILKAILTAIDDDINKPISHKLALYDYTKRLGSGNPAIDRDLKTCKELNYHLTPSHGSKYDTFLAAIEYGLNYAAAFDKKKSEKLPEYIIYRNRKLRVIDADISDYRIDDPNDQTYIAGLRIKRTPNQSKQQRQAFCIA